MIKKANKGRIGSTHDKVMTPPEIAKQIINWLPINKGDTLLDPCKGKGAFFDNFPPPQFGLKEDSAEIHALKLIVVKKEIK